MPARSMCPRAKRRSRSPATLNAPSTTRRLRPSREMKVRVGSPLKPEPARVKGNAAGTRVHARAPLHCIVFLVLSPFLKSISLFPLHSHHHSRDHLCGLHVLHPLRLPRPAGDGLAGRAESANSPHGEHETYCKRILPQYVYVITRRPGCSMAILHPLAERKPTSAHDDFFFFPPRNSVRPPSSTTCFPRT